MKKGSYVCEKVTCSRLRDSRVLRIEKAQTGKKKRKTEETGERRGGENETRGTFDPLHVRDFLQNLQHLERWTARSANAVSEDMKLLTLA